MGVAAGEEDVVARDQILIPPDTNPFSVVTDECIDDGVYESELPEYFGCDHTESLDCSSFARQHVVARGLTTKEATALLRRAKEHDPIPSLAVKERFSEMIPVDLMREVPVTTTEGPRCQSKDCYFLPDKRPMR